MRCPRCGAENPPGLSPCEICGIPLVQGEKWPTMTDKPVPAPPPAAPGWGPPQVQAPAWPQHPLAPQAPPQPAQRASPQPTRAPAPVPPAPVELARSQIAATQPHNTPSPQIAQVPQGGFGGRTSLAAPMGDARRPVRGALVEYGSPSDAGKVHGLRAGSNALGRDAECDVVLEDQRISKKHAVIVIRSDEATYMDVSSNGSVVDGRLVQAATVPLRQGSVILLGTRRILFMLVPEKMIWESK